MMRREMRLVLALLAAGAFSCGERGAGHHDADGAQPTGTRDAGGRASQMPGDLPSLCTSCMPQPMPGGDTTDFGQTPARTCQSHQRPERRSITIEQAEADGFNFAQQLAAAEGHHEFTVRWTDPARSAPTLLTVEVRATGRAQLTTWVEEMPDSTSSLLPCAPASDFAWPEVEVQIVTADHAVAGSFISVLKPFDASQSSPPLWIWSVEGDGSSLQGELAFPADPGPHQLVVTLTVMHYIDGTSADRAELRVQLHRVAPAAGDNQVIHGYTALPPDGCAFPTVPLELTPPRPCDPWTQDGCCMLASRGPVRQVGFADEDAGALP